MKVKAAIKRICGYCFIVRRGKYLYVRCEKFNRHKQRQGFSTLDQNLQLDKERFCECEGEKRIDLSQEEQKLYNIIEEECDCCQIKSQDSDFDEFKNLDNLKMI